jgi:hypothetical protein
MQFIFKSITVYIQWLSHLLKPIQQMFLFETGYCANNYLCLYPPTCMSDTFFVPCITVCPGKREEAKNPGRMCKKTKPENLVSDTDFLAHFAIKLLP